MLIMRYFGQEITPEIMSHGQIMRVERSASAYLAQALAQICSKIKDCVTLFLEVSNLVTIE